MTILRTSQDQSSRMELALALARLVGQEHHFVQLWRYKRSEIGTATTQIVITLKKRMSELHLDSEGLVTVMNDCAEALTRENLERGVTLTGHVIRLLPLEEFDEICTMILQDCAERIDEFGTKRIEYLFLALHTMHAGTAQKQHAAFTRVFH
jgi:hypothetical protein